MRKKQLTHGQLTEDTAKDYANLHFIVLCKMFSYHAFYLWKGCTTSQLCDSEHFLCGFCVINTSTRSFHFCYSSLWPFKGTHRGASLTPLLAAQVIVSAYPQPHIPSVNSRRIKNFWLACIFQRMGAGSINNTLDKISKSFNSELEPKDLQFYLNCNCIIVQIMFTCTVILGGGWNQRKVCI